MAAKLQKISPFLWYHHQAEDAAKIYVSLFPNSRIVAPAPRGVIFELDGSQFIAFNGGDAQTLNHAVSLMVRCDDQKEVDFYWEKLLADGGREVQCGWLVDKFGLSWQIVPNILFDFFTDKDQAKADRAFQAMMGMVKLDIAALTKAFEGK